MVIAFSFYTISAIEEACTHTGLTSKLSGKSLTMFHFQGEGRKDVTLFF